MAKAESELDAGISADRYLAAVTDFKSYPEFVPGCDHVEMKDLSPTESEVTYSVEIMGQKIGYTLLHERKAGSSPRERLLTWKLKDSAFLAHNQGIWTITDTGADACHVRYSIEIEFKLPVPGFLLNRLVKSQLPALLKSFETQAKS